MRRKDERYPRAAATIVLQSASVFVRPAAAAPAAPVAEKPVKPRERAGEAEVVAAAVASDCRVEVTAAHSETTQVAKGEGMFKSCG
ncbi:hypothetical protein AB0C12_07595 [Actinoplanes sp. NPDC048967]|uniref:hypothetical protein n=1 Tax=Actinoplanes sp. NPDC048967 TaxID=3155269 RepID=UPI0033E6DA1A